MDNLTLAYVLIALGLLLLVAELFLPTGGVLFVLSVGALIVGVAMTFAYDQSTGMVTLVAGFVMGVATLGVISRATDPHGLVVARTMGLTTFALTHVFFAVCTRDERRSLFNLDTFSDRPLLIACGAAALAIILESVFGPLQRLLDTAAMNLQEWLICVGVALSIVVVSELRKLLIHRSLDEASS